MTSEHELPALLALPAVPPEDGDPFIDALIEAARRNVDRPAAAIAVVPTQFFTAGGWCAPYDPDRASRPNPALPSGVEYELAVPRLACGCTETVLETGTHEPGCTVLDIPTEAAL
jgi:hypothetical protein